MEQVKPNKQTNKQQLRLTNARDATRLVFSLLVRRCLRLADEPLMAAQRIPPRHPTHPTNRSSHTKPTGHSLSSSGCHLTSVIMKQLDVVNSPAMMLSTNVRHTTECRGKACSVWLANVYIYRALQGLGQTGGISCIHQYIPSAVTPEKRQLNTLIVCLVAIFIASLS